ncbi:Hypothetical protein SMAX5B_004960 [Scophthalmus maximus]|uniref:Uncharacterized protein n=1 Tax=Scophthalmus maximus TaxID=52904 RepID=A0A2U9BQA5_SCOMX|nr:Hypothetical protein SMAX5B_004960 [Scophthalmus maximus]
MHGQIGPKLHVKSWPDYIYKTIFAHSPTFWTQKCSSSQQSYGLMQECEGSITTAHGF